jgi:hypothetical protein
VEGVSQEIINYSGVKRDILHISAKTGQGVLSFDRCEKVPSSPSWEVSAAPLRALILTGI